MLTANVIGNLGNDPDMRYSANGQPRLQFNVAANARQKNAQNEWVDSTSWVRVTVFGNRAEPLAEILKKGTKVYASGRLEARPWTSRDGNISPGLEIIANEIELCSSRQDTDGYSRPSNTVNAPSVAAQGQTDDSDLESLAF
jgi:single-strand DNA-binding protein